MLDVLRSAGVAALEPVVALTADELVVQAFERYLLSERGLTPGTARGYTASAGRFVAGVEGADGLGAVRTADVISAVQARSEAVSVATAQNFVAGVKAFLRFCFVEGLVGRDLAEAALPVTGRRRSCLPRGISCADAEAL